MCEHKKVKTLTGALIDKIYVVVTHTCVDCGAYRCASVTVLKEPGFNYCGQTTTPWIPIQKETTNVG